MSYVLESSFVGVGEVPVQGSATRQISVLHVQDFYQGVLVKADQKILLKTAL